MKTSGTEHFIERTYREGGTFQWVRETLMNAIEAEATRIEYGIEWQAVESKGVYRRMIADNGLGMTGSQLVEFFNTFGGGGKPSAACMSFGVGEDLGSSPGTATASSSSWECEPSMIWVRYDEEAANTGYGWRGTPRGGCSASMRSAGHTRRRARMQLGGISS